MLFLYNWARKNLVKRLTADITMNIRPVLAGTFFLLSLVPNLGSRLSAEIIIHIQHPWASDSARLANPLYIQSNETGWHPGAIMLAEGGNWYTYTLRRATPTSNDRIEFMSAIPSPYYQYDNALKYIGGTSQLIFNDIFADDTTATEVWITVTDTTARPTIKFTPPPGKAVYFFKPWDLGGTGIILRGFSPVKMRGIKNRCGWFRHNYYGSEDDLVVRFFNPIDTTFYSVAGIGDSTFLDLRGSFTEGDTVWVVPDPLPDGPPKIYTSDPGITAECGTITLAAKFLDKGEHPDFGTADEFTLVKGLVKDRLSSDGKPEAATDSSKFMKQFDWFIPEDFGNGYTNEICRNLVLHKNSDGLYEYDTDAFFPVDDFEYLDVARTIRNPNHGSQSGHNYHFTMELSCEFEYVKGQTFYFRGDDDVWVFIDSQLVVDIGGVHDAIEGAVNLDTLGLIEGKTYNFKLFFVERYCCGSNFRVVTSINLRTSSRFFYAANHLAQGITQYDMYEKVTTSNLSCDFSDEPTDTQKAVVEFYLGGPPFTEPVHLLSGVSYGGITISADYTSFVIDESAFQGLSPGNYTITFYSSFDRSQGGSVMFTIPEVVKPPRITNPLVKGAYYADNGWGQVNRAELYFQNEFTSLPDSILLSWPSILDHKMVYRDGGIILDSLDKTHLTVKLSDPFEKEVTTFAGSDQLGFCYSYDTSFADPLEIVPLRISDSVGPLIKSAVLIERTSPGPDTLMLTFTETVERESIIGNSLILVKGNAIDTLNVLSFQVRLDTLIVVAGSSGTPPAIGDSVRINPGGPFTDNYLNHGHPLNRPVPLKLKRTPAEILHVFYRDVNADGMVDEAVIELDRVIDLTGIVATFAWSDGIRAENITSERLTRGESETVVRVDLSNAFTGDISERTSGLMYVNLEYIDFPGVNKSSVVADSAAPVLTSALYIPGLYETDPVPDTLIVEFSEQVENIRSMNPFLFRSSTSLPFTITLETVRHNENRWVFTVRPDDQNTVYPAENDSVWIDTGSGIADTLSNRQDNTMNRRVLLRVKETLPDYTVSIGPNPFNPHIDMITIRIDPKVRTRGSVRFRADVKIYDQIGNRVISISKENNPSESFLDIKWNGRNSKGRVVGIGIYLCIVSVTDPGLKIRAVTGHKIGVKSR